LPGRYTLDSFVINSGNTISATARITLSSGDDKFENVACGDGPVDAAFKAINMITGKDYTLEDYSLRAVTEGEDALGEAIVKISCCGETVTGRGVSTDVIEASIKAYLSGGNKCLQNS
jgi:2-isopropylmalate synthase